MTPRSTKALREFELIEWIRRRPQSFPPSVLKAIGDDGAVFDTSSLRRMVATCDSLVEDVHFRPRWTSYRFLGRKALAVSASDLGAMGARPYACLLNLVLPQASDSSQVQALLSGFLEECARLQCPLVGGNISSGSQLQMSVTAWGDISQGEAVLRSGASPGDRIYLVGGLGWAGQGLRILKEEDPDLSQIEDESALNRWAGDDRRFACLKAQFLPDPPLSWGTHLQSRGEASAMIDVSDGLAADLGHLLKESSLKAVLTPSHWFDLGHAAGQGAMPGCSFKELMEGGGDYSLLFTSPSVPSAPSLDSSASPIACTMLGRLEKGPPTIIIDGPEKQSRYRRGGFEHFR